MNYGCVAKLGGFWFLDDDCGTLKERYESGTGHKFPQTFAVKTRKGYHYYLEAHAAQRGMDEQPQGA
jgi:hypothetical protein